MTDRSPSGPPEGAVRLLTRVLRGDPAGPAILGDLREDFHRAVQERGASSARRWYWREAVALALRRAFRTSVEGRSRAGRSGPEAATGAAAPLRAALQDGLSAARSMRRNPGFTVFTAAVIGLGIGSATAVFSILKPLLLAPLPFEDPDALVWIANEAEAGDNSLAAVTSRSANLHDFRERARSFAALTGYNAFFDHEAYTLTGLGEPERLVGADVAHDFLDVLGVEPVHGRGFSADEGRVGGPPAMILSHAFWQRRFAGDPSVVGRSLALGDRAHVVVGVLPRTFDFSAVFSPGVEVDVLIPYPVIAAGDAGFQGNTLFMVGRLRPGVTPEAARAELDGILAQLGQEDPGRWGLGAELEPLRDHLAGPYRSGLLLLAAGAGTLLLIVCVNTSSLLLARAPRRAGELAVRSALGASRGRLVRQLVLETLGIALTGAALGSAMAWGVTGFVARSASLPIPLLDQVRVDGAALAFAAAVATLAGLLVGLVPALRVAGGRMASALAEGGRRGGTGRAAHHLREALVVGQVALACVLLVVGGLLMRSFRAVLDVDLGFQSADVVAWQLDPGRDFESPRARTDFHTELVDRVQELAGIERVGLIDALPLGRNQTLYYHVVGDPGEDRTDNRAFPHVIDEGYLATLRIPVLEGRGVSRDDTEEAPRVVLLNESGARRIFGGEAALGRKLRFFGPWEWEVVGIVRDVRHLSPELGPGVQAYFPFGQMISYQTMDLVVRSRLPPERVADQVGAALSELDPSMPVREFWTVESTVDRAVSTRRFTLAILGAFGLVALLLAALGIYGVLANSVAERRQEIGIRMALGATAAGVIGNVLGRSLVLAGVGVATGAVLSLLAARLVGSLLFGVSATDPLTFLGMATVLLLVAAVAGLVPAVRAAGVRGVRVIRGD